MFVTYFGVVDKDVDRHVGQRCAFSVELKESVSQSSEMIGALVATSVVAPQAAGMAPAIRAYPQIMYLF